MHFDATRREPIQGPSEARGQQGAPEGVIEQLVDLQAVDAAVGVHAIERSSLLSSEARIAVQAIHGQVAQPSIQERGRGRMRHALRRRDHA